LPSAIAGTIYYKPTANGYEARIKEWLDKRGQENDT
jgi:putative ATPase